jgi:hypothetical protein
MLTPQIENDRKTEILNAYINLVKTLKRNVRMNDLCDIGITKDMVTHHFRNLSRLNEYARQLYPDAFHDVYVQLITGPHQIQQLRDKASQYKRFLITSAVTGCYVNTDFLNSMENYCKVNNAMILVLMASDPAHDKKSSFGYIDKTLINSPYVSLVTEDTKLNSNLFLSTIKLSAKHIDPLTGLARIGQRNGSFIYASPKQRMKLIPTSNNKSPCVQMTPGAVTLPDYSTQKYMSERTGYIATHDHIMGAIIVEIEDNNLFHFRQIQSDFKGSFIDLGTQYNADSTCDLVTPSAFILGDWHATETDPIARDCWISVMKHLRPENLVLHDAFSGVSINHHEANYKILKAQRASAGQLSLQEEVKALAKDLNDLSEFTDQIVIVKSNHDEFLNRYLESGLSTSDPINYRFALDLAAKQHDGFDPLKWATEQNGLIAKNIKWLSRDEDFIIAGIQLGAHGDLGANGSRGSLAAMERAYGQSVSGHSHTPEILRGAWQVGTSSFLKLSYNRGASSWLQSSCLLYPSGARQLINIIEGKWKL